MVNTLVINKVLVDGELISDVYSPEFFSTFTPIFGYRYCRFVNRRSVKLFFKLATFDYSYETLMSLASDETVNTLPTLKEWLTITEDGIVEDPLTFESALRVFGFSQGFTLYSDAAKLSEDTNIESTFNLGNN